MKIVFLDYSYEIFWMIDETYSKKKFKIAFLSINQEKNAV